MLAVDAGWRIGSLWVFLAVLLGLLRLALGNTGPFRERLFRWIAQALALPNNPSSAEAVRVSLLEIVDSCLLAGALFFLLVRPFIVQAFFVPSGSMEPVLRGTGPAPRDHILVNKFVYRFRLPRRQEIVAFKAIEPVLRRCPQCHATARLQHSWWGDGWVCTDHRCRHREPAASKVLVKRLIGLPGETVELRGRTVYIRQRDGSVIRLDEPYVAEPPNDAAGRYPVPGGHYFVLGDNRNRSLDSRAWGPLPGQQILGKAMAIFWPLNRIRLLR